MSSLDERLAQIRREDAVMARYDTAYGVLLTLTIASSVLILALKLIGHDTRAVATIGVVSGAAGVLLCAAAIRHLTRKETP